jgi:hypothetical protein
MLFPNNLVFFKMFVFTLRFLKMLETKWEYNETVHFKKAYDSVRRKVLYNILIKFGVP